MFKTKLKLINNLIYECVDSKTELKKSKGLTTLRAFMFLNLKRFC